MRVGRLLLALGCGIGLATAGSLTAYAAEARPWLCRNKPVFSSSSAMTYQVANHGGAGREVVLIKFEPGRAHDRDEIVGSEGLSVGGGEAKRGRAACRPPLG